MKNRAFIPGALGMGVVIAFLAVLSSQAMATTTSCTAPGPIEQPFLYAGDSNYYAPLSGESFDNLSGTGWTLSNGAKIVTTTLADGTTGSVLDLPSGSKAVSPEICVTNEYPSARTLVRNAVGSQSVTVQMAYRGTSSWGGTKNVANVTGSGTAWMLSNVLKLPTGNLVGWNVARFTFVAAGKSSDSRIYNFYVDPRMH
jgi:hypothetical protein